MGVEVRFNHLPEFLAELRQQAAMAVRDAAEATERRAKELVPVRTGRLRDSIGASVEGLEASVGSDVEYAPVVELGGRNRPPHPYLGPAAQEGGRVLVEKLSK